MDRLTLTLYDKNKIEYKTIESIKDLEEIKSDKYYWLNIENIQAQDLKNLNDKFNIHPLVLEDLSNLNQRPKFEEHDEYLFFIIEIHHLLNKYFINYKNGFNSNIQRVQIGFLMFNNLLITATSSKQKIKLNLENIIKSSKPIKKFGLDFLLYYIIDYIYELEYNILEIIGEKIDDIEDKILQDPERKDLNYIYKIKKDLIYIRKSLWPAQNVIRNIIVSGDISHKIEFYFQDLQSRTVQSIDIIETYHEICSSMLDTYLSSIGNKTNEIMRVLTVFSTIFIPLTFIAGVYGMNFRYFPELNFKYSYPLFWIISVIITIGMIFYFKRKDWL